MISPLIENVNRWILPELFKQYKMRFSGGIKLSGSNFSRANWFAIDCIVGVC